MKQEDKQLLLADLCARLPYGVKIRLGDYDYQVCGYNSEKEMPLKIWYYYNLNLKSYIDVYLTDYRPYLRPMSSMTEEEKKEFIEYTGYEIEESVNGRHYEYYLKDFCGTPDNPSVNADGIDWLNKKMFDYRGLIERNLAIDCSNLNIYD